MEARIAVRLLGEADVEDYRVIRLSALKTEPSAFGSVHALEAERPLTAYQERLASSLIFGAYDQTGRIVGMAGLRQETGPKERHKGYIWGVYVEPAYQGAGVGRALITVLLEKAAGMVEQVRLSVVADHFNVIAFYERLGFVRYGTEPMSLKMAGRYTDEVLMILFLAPTR